MKTTSASWLALAVCFGAQGCTSNQPRGGDETRSTAATTHPSLATDAAVSEDSARPLLDASSLPSFPPTRDARAWGKAPRPALAFAAFSQVNPGGSDPQILQLAPDIVPRAWSQWSLDGTRAEDYDFNYAVECQARGTRFIGGLTASVIFEAQMSAAEFANEVGRDAQNNPVPHSEIVAGAYRGSLASSGFRQRLIEIAKLQIDGGVDGIFFDEVNAGYLGSAFDGNEGFDDHRVADFGRFLCAKHAATLSSLMASAGFTAEDGFDCGGADPGADFDYRGYLARHGAETDPLSDANPLAAEWGVALPNRPNPETHSFVDTVDPLVHWQDIVLQVRTYARQVYNKEILITANGMFPFVDFQSIGLSEWNHDGEGPMGFDWMPVVNGHYDGSVSFLDVLASLKGGSQRIVTAGGGTEVPILLFLDWPGSTVDRYYALPLSERQDYIRLFLAEAYSLGLLLAVPLATTTDTHTASSLGMLDLFGELRDYYRNHAELFDRATDVADVPVVSSENVASRLTRLADGRTVLHLVNHNYANAIVPQEQLSVSFPLSFAPDFVTLASPEATADTTLPFEYDGQSVTLTIDRLVASASLTMK